MKAKKAVLPNGLRLITIPLKDSSTVAVYVLAEVGSRHERKEEAGLAHFLEHMLFKGTVSRPNAKAINTELDALGAQSNAFTGHEFTGYYAKAHSRHVGKILDVLSDVYINSTFPSAEIEKEKGVIVEEINMYDDLPHKKVHDIFQGLLYGDQSVGRPILGNKKTVRKMKTEDFRAFCDRHYTAENTVVVVAGNFSETAVRTAVTKAFEAIPKKGKPKKEKVQEEQKRPRSVLLARPSEQTHLILGFRAISARNKSAQTLAVLTALLGEGMSSRLFHRLREELGICYYVRASFDESTDFGSFIVSAGVDPARSLEAIEAILSELQRVKEERVSDVELEKVKEYMIGSMYLSLETADSLAGFYGFDEIIRRSLKSPLELEQEIRKVTPKMLQDMAKRIFVEASLNLAMVGKVPTTKAVQAILRLP